MDSGLWLITMARGGSVGRSVTAGRGGTAVGRPIGVPPRVARWAAEDGGAAASRRPVGLGGGRPGGDRAHAAGMLERRGLPRGRAPASLHQSVGEAPMKWRRRALADTAGARSVASNVGSEGWKPYVERTRPLLEPEPGANGPKGLGRPSPRPSILAAPGNNGPPHRVWPNRAH
jgi:hypothetical protein